MILLLTSQLPFSPKRATLVISGPSGERQVESDAFFTDFWETEVKEDELLTEILVPKYTGESWAYQKI
ncbi:MAG: hypothetical protein Ct9H90mP5_10260 [Acidimicrobiaceae bacterium]|nr:MAG: hypothetical protein Ct9H90mP5_10260 [Acidimicrobiaceae bacterium]